MDVLINYIIKIVIILYNHYYFLIKELPSRHFISVNTFNIYLFLNISIVYMSYLVITECFKIAYIKKSELISFPVITICLIKIVIPS